MKENPTGYTVYRPDPKNPARFTPEERSRLEAMTDDDIDYSDIPSQAGKLWTRPGALIPAENKQQITLRLDADIVTFFKETGSRYQSRINAVLREYMKAHQQG
ncbi:BrnA antitoxin family protein [Silvibacterium dinghuense]|nr:BrnA antitoxin family protein [Silvibacterium dinghuense]